MRKMLKELLDLLGHAGTLNAIIHSEFVRSWLLPVVATMLTGGSGIFGGAQLVWVFVASAIVFMSVTFGMVAHLVLKERQTPQNKLVAKPVFQCDLTPKRASSNW